MTVKFPEIWLKYASDDLQSAKLLLEQGIYNMVCFHFQQVVEKLLKSLIASYHQEIPRIHNLVRLRKICEDLHGSHLSLDAEGLIFLNDVYIDSRYPADFGILPSGQPDEKEASKAYKYAKNFDKHLRTLIRKRIDQTPNQDKRTKRQ
jgi:HEPN domain-containing protein